MSQHLEHEPHEPTTFSLKSRQPNQDAPAMLRGLRQPTLDQHAIGIHRGRHLMSDGNGFPGDAAGGETGGAAGMGPFNPWASVFSSSLMRLIAEKSEDPRFRDMAAAVVTPGTEIMLVRPGIVFMADRLRQGEPHNYLPLLASWTLPAVKVFMIFEREGIEHGVLAETLPGDMVALKHVRVGPSGSLEQPLALSVLDLEAQRPFVVVNELPCGSAGPEAEADRIWMSWFHSIANPVCAGGGTILEEQRRRWFHWLLDDLAILAVAFSKSNTITPQARKFDPDFSIRPEVESVG